ncbi:hypothetical protein UFOVP613_20 [uncultured Caudovirales phage]|uniref:AdoMet_MTases domain containing protein n=1 Tax=uncultured Caudovirales phage TaxID=2100421 RepID=A0A6J5NAD2_9CAUD|nr:hypothetical protein UFOVP613_20 [uncultured Caudovirales phage]
MSTNPNESTWRTRITGHDLVDPQELLANPGNWRIHPKAQQAAMSGVLDEIGWIQSIIVNTTTGHVVDGHMRCAVALSRGETQVPVAYVELSPEEESLALATLDPIGAMAVADDDLLSELLAELPDQKGAVADLLADLADTGSNKKTTSTAPTIAERFGIVPFSVLDQRSGTWRERKARWMSLGIRSELGRDANHLGMSDTIYRERTPDDKRHNRGVLLASLSGTIPDYYLQKEKVEARLGHSLTNSEFEEKHLVIRGSANLSTIGTSVFDPVLCEIAYRWFSPPGAEVLDPFSGGSVRGIVAAILGRRYTGIDLRAEQVVANESQADAILPGIQAPPATQTTRSVVPTGANKQDSGAGAYIGTEYRPRIRSERIAAHPASLEALELYAATSGLPLLERWAEVPASLRPYLEEIYRAAGQDLLVGAEVPTQAWAELTDTGAVWVAFSGGKDGLAAALAARDQGFTPILYHLRGINRGKSEHRQALEAARAARMPILIDHVAVQGTKQGFVEMPTKNQVIAELMAARMAQFGGSRYAMGTTDADVQERLKVDLNYSDGVTAVALFHEHLKARFPGIVHMPLVKNETHALARVAAEGLLGSVSGCMEQRFLSTKRAATERKHGALPLPNRCGGCTKCASEYLNLAALGAVPESPALYGYALARMTEVMKRETLGYTDAESYYIDQEDLPALRRSTWAPAPNYSPAEVELPGMQTPSPSEANLSDPEGRVIPPEAGVIHPPRWITGDSRDIPTLLPEDYRADLVFSCPPYADLERYSDDPADLSTLTWEEFLPAYRQIIAAAVARLRDDRFAVWVVGDVRAKSGNGSYRGLILETIQAFRDAGAELYNEAILVSPVGSLPIRIARQFSGGRKLGKTHQNILVFIKGDARRAVAELGAVEVDIPDEDMEAIGEDGIEDGSIGEL